MSAREDILRRIRGANGAAGSPPAAPVPRDYHRTGDHTPGAPELLDLFRDRLLDYRATVLDAPDDDIPTAIRRALADIDGPVLVPSGYRSTGAHTASPTTPTTRPSSTGSPRSSPDARPPVPRPARSRSTVDPPRAAAPSPSSPTFTSASSAPTSSSTPSPSCSPHSHPAARSRSSADRQRRATSNWSGSKGYTAPAHSSSSSPDPAPQEMAHHRGTEPRRPWPLMTCAPSTGG